MGTGFPDTKARDEMVRCIRNQISVMKLEESSAEVCLRRSLLEWLNGVDESPRGNSASAEQGRILEVGVVWSPADIPGNTWSGA